MRRSLTVFLLAGAVSLLSACEGNSSRDSGQRSERPAVVWVVGDGPDGGEDAAEMAARITGERMDRFLYLGDVYENGTAREYARYYEPLYGRLARFTEPTPGNHEWPQRRQGYNAYWARAKGRPQPPWYSFKLAGWTFLSLNSEAPHGPRSPQLRWLAKELDEGRGTCRLAFWHSPRFSAGADHGDDPDVQPFWDLLSDRTTIVLNGHEHDLQRFRPVRGITQFVVGAGGHTRTALDRADDRLAFGHDDEDGGLRLEMRPGEARFQFISDDGVKLDSGTVPCRRG